MRVVFEVVPIFTGYSTKLIETKIKGVGGKWITGGQYNNVEDVISHLERVYSLKKSVCQLQGELVNILYINWIEKKWSPARLVFRNLKKKFKKLIKQTIMVE